MSSQKGKWLEISAKILILLMVLLQAGYAIFAYLKPESFALFRGTELVAVKDVDWIIIYASRTLFISLLVGFLLLKKAYSLLAWASLSGIVMPASDAYLAYQAHAASAVIYKHVGTGIYLLITFFVLRSLIQQQKVT